MPITLMAYHKRQPPAVGKRLVQFNVKLTVNEKAFLQRAAQTTFHKNLSWYMVESALKQAQADLRQTFTEDNHPPRKSR